MQICIALSPHIGFDGSTSLPRGTDLYFFQLFRVPTSGFAHNGFIFLTKRQLFVAVHLHSYADRRLKGGGVPSPEGLR